MPKNNRAYRRQVAEKLKVRRKAYHRAGLFVDAYHAFEWRSYLHHTHTLRMADMPLIPQYANTPCPCSCAMCGNPRRRGDVTLAERRADASFRQQVTDYDPELDSIMDELSLELHYPSTE